MAKILIVDDEKLFRLSTRELLEKWGYAVFEAKQGEEALEILSREELDLVLLDLNLPDIPGEVLLQSIQTQQKDLPVIIVTAYAAVESAVQTLKAGAYDYLLKPLQEEALQHAIAKALDRMQLQKENKQLWKALQRKILELSLLNELSMTLNSTMDLRELLPLVMEKTHALANTEASSLLLYDEKSEELYFSVALGEKGSLVKDLRLKKGEGIAGWVALQGEPLLVADVHADPRFAKWVDETTRFSTRSILCVPLRVRKKIIGVIQLINRQDGRPFDQADLDFTNSIASLAGIAIENARLYEEVVEYSHTLESKVQQKVEELQQAQAKLIKTERAAALGRLAAGVAHDINSPLAGLKNYLYLMAQDLSLEHPYQSHLRMMENAIDRIAQVSRDLVEFAHPQDRGVKRTKINLHKTLESAFMLMGKYLRDKQCQLVKEFCPQELQVQADWGEVLQVVISLLMEALDAQTEGGQIKLTTGEEALAPTGGRVWLQIDFTKAYISQKESWQSKEISKILEGFGGDLLWGNLTADGRGYSRITLFFPVE